MHEIHLLKELLSDVLKHAQKNKFQAVTKVNLRMGEFTEINPEILRYYFKENAKNTAAENAELNIQPSPSRELRLVSIDGK